MCRWGKFALYGVVFVLLLVPATLAQGKPTYLFPLGGEPPRLDPPNVGTLFEIQVISEIYNQLVRFNPVTGEVEPDLAES
ncbi:MAG: hypothetical protein HY335_09575, partial [Deinococcus sp.]|nr:hypothetical protein [Deinococcus sp.]